MIGDWLLSRLACPKDRGSLAVSGGALLCAQNHRFPLIDDVPILLRDDVPQTQWVAEATLRAAKEGGSALFIETLGLDAEERVAARFSAPISPSEVDPVVQRLVAQTGGILYRGLRGRLNRYPIPELRTTAGNEGEVFLDIGCNWGRWSVAAARRGFKVIGIDPSIGAIMAAKRVAAQLSADAHFIAADARYLPLSDGSVDVAFSYSVFQHFDKDNARAAIGECGRVLRPGGRAMIQMPNRFGIRSLFHQARRGFREPRNFEVRYWSPGELTKTFEDLVGRSALDVDGFFGLGIQKSDLPLLPAPYRFIVSTSEMLRGVAGVVGPLKLVADSLYVNAIKSKSSVISLR